MTRTASSMLPLGTPMPDFALPDVRRSAGDADRIVSASTLRGAPASLVVFWCNHCPYVQHIADAFVRFAADMKERGVPVVAISSNDPEAYPDDGPDAMARVAQASGYGFPYLFDATQEVARAFDAACTPDFYLFDAAGRLAYRGRFDAARPDNDITPTGTDLRTAVARVLDGERVPDDQHPSLGCNIKWTSDPL